MTGNNSGTNAGTYTATYTPDANHKWSDGTTDAIIVKLTINVLVIKFNGNGSILGNMDDFNLTKADDSLPGVGFFEKEGWTFIGWSSSEGVKGKQNKKGVKQTPFHLK